MSWSPDPNQPMLATVADGSVRIWDPHTGRCLHALSDPDRRMLTAAWSPTPSARILATGGSPHPAGTANAAVRLWDPDTGQCLHSLTDGIHVARIHSLAWSPTPHPLQLATTAQPAAHIYQITP